MYQFYDVKLAEPCNGLSKPRIVGIWDLIFGLKIKKYKQPLNTKPIKIIPKANPAIAPARIIFYHFKKLNNATPPAKAKINIVSPTPAMAPTTRMYKW